MKCLINSTNKMFKQHYLSNVLKILNGDTISKPLSYNFRHKNNIFNSEQPYKDIEFDL